MEWWKTFDHICSATYLWWDFIGDAVFRVCLLNKIFVDDLLLHVRFVGPVYADHAVEPMTLYEFFLIFYSFIFFLLPHYMTTRV